MTSRPLGELLVDDPFWQYPAWGLAREGAGHLRVWATATASPGYLVGAYYSEKAHRKLQPLHLIVALPVNWLTCALWSSQKKSST